MGGGRSRLAAAFIHGTSAFDLVSAAEPRGAVRAGLSVGGKVGPVDLRFGYEGEFNREVTSHGGKFRMVVPIGRHPEAPLLEVPEMVHEPLSLPADVIPPPPVQ